MQSLILRGISLGFSAGVLPGPLQAYIISAALTMGWRRSIVIIFSPLITDIPIATAIVFILGQLPEGVISWIRIAGGLFLLWLAYGALKQYRAGLHIGAPASSASTQGALLRGMAMNFLSPGPYLFWSTVTGPLLLEGLRQSLWHGVAFLLAFYGTFLGLLALTVFLFDRLRQLDERVTRGLVLLTILILVVFSAQLMLQGLNIL